MQSKIILWILFSSIVSAFRRLVIDRKSCSDVDDYNAIRAAAGAAIEIAHQAADLLEPYVMEGAAKPDDTYLEPARLLFGGDDPATLERAFKRLYNIGTLDIEDYDIYGPEWSATKSNQDVVIVCNADHIQRLPYSDDRPNINYIDVIQDAPVRDDRVVLVLKNNPAGIQACTSAAPAKKSQFWSKRAVEVVTICPLYLQEDKELSYPVYNNDRIENARYDSLLAHLNTLDADIRPVDILQTLQFTLLHEFQHLSLAGAAIDADGPDSYEWLNCRRLRTADNAENMAYFALLIDLVKNHRVRVDENGVLSPL